MSREQRFGKQRKWTLKDIQKGLDTFYKKEGRYPTATEFDAFKFLPSSRTIQRSFGGLVNLRRELKLKGQIDFTKGAHSSQRAKYINVRAHTLEKIVYDYLVKIFGKEFVHREHFFSDDKRTRTDFFIYCQDGNFSVDVFHPANRYNLIGCLNSKLRTYGKDIMLQYPVIFLQMNEAISRGDILSVLERKKVKLHKYQSVMTFDQFKNFCKAKTRLRVGRSSV